MNFSFSEEQQMLKDSVERFVKDNYDMDARNNVAKMEHCFSVDNWKSFAELGWLSVPFAEEYGGFNGNYVDLMVVMESLGAGIVLEPYIPTVVLFGGLIKKGSNEALKAQFIERIIDGSQQGAFAYLERQSHYQLNDVKTEAKQDGKDFIINGSKALVLNGMAADDLIVSVRTSGSQYDEDGLSLFVVNANADGVSRNAIQLMDGQQAANITFSDVRVSAEQLLCTEGQGFQLIESVVNDAIIAVGSEAVGIMQKLKDDTVEYSKTRKQFGVEIGTFQALQHRMVDMFMACEQTRSLLYRAVCSLDDNENRQQSELAKDILALKIMVGRAGQMVGAEAIQLHGGMGMTEELAIGHYVKRLMTINTMFGDADYQQKKFSAM